MVEKLASLSYSVVTDAKLAVGVHRAARVARRQTEHEPESEYRSCEHSLLRRLGRARELRVSVQPPTTDREQGGSHSVAALGTRETAPLGVDDQPTMLVASLETQRVAPADVRCTLTAGDGGAPIVLSVNPGSSGRPPSCVRRMGPRYTWQGRRERLIVAGMRQHIFLAALGLAALHADAGHAQSPCRRCLDGFRYLPSSIVGDAFATTHFENATGGGMALNLNVPVRNAEGATIDSLSGNIGFLLVDFGYQKRLARWLALNGTIIAAGRVGTSIEAVAASGASAAFGWALGATAPLLDRQKFLVSAVGEYRHNTEYDINPYEFAQQIVDSGYTQKRRTLCSPVAA
jgi:hypothetical protein